MERLRSDGRHERLCGLDGEKRKPILQYTLLRLRQRTGTWKLQPASVLLRVDRLLSVSSKAASRSNVRSRSVPAGHRHLGPPNPQSQGPVQIVKLRTWNWRSWRSSRSYI